MATTPLPLRALPALAALTVACTPLAPTEPTQDTAAVDYVLDGDTIEATAADGNSQCVRLLGINTPEIPHDDQPGQCGGEAAAEQLRTLLPEGTPVELISDPEADDEDRYGRRLRYVELADGTDTGAALITAGYAYAWAPSSNRSTAAQRLSIAVTSATAMTSTSAISRLTSSRRVGAPAYVPALTNRPQQTLIGQSSRRG
ncbi:thermonuclease family protein [Brachybacterium paraconglomeratum]|uniref:thermonuclease family protein n=1 Tax=Brachybacterium paraconglomeratum TaxID=173362 RepID=UPI00248F7677|nr:thermonuclease family protein [Brachybacterium paraconglomeratum]